MVRGGNPGHAQVHLGEVLELDGGVLLRWRGHGGACCCGRRFGFVPAGLDHGLDLLHVDAGQQRFEGRQLMTQQRLLQCGPVQRTGQETLCFFSHGRQYRFQVGHQYPEQVDPHTANGLHLSFGSLLLRQYPGLFLVDILVGPVRQRHDLAHGFVEFALFIEVGHGCAPRNELLHQGRFRAGVGQAVGVTPGQEAGAATCDIDNLADHIGIHPLHEVLQVEVDIVHRAAEFGGEVVAQVLRVEVLEVGAGLDKGAATLGHLVAVHREEAMGIDRGRSSQAR